MMKSLLAHFFLADMRDGLGPFLGVFLQEKAWSPAEIRPGCRNDQELSRSKQGGQC
jgi:hypothetical protein